MATVQILVGGTDVTADVVYATARFQSKVNGSPGDGYMRVRDDASTYSFTAGADWLVLVDGSAAWRGFVMAIRRVYIAPAMDVAESGLQRFIDLSGPDGNILLTRRVVAKASSPATVEGTQFAAGTADTTAITDLLVNWLDLSADSIDTSSGVTHVGNLDPAQKTRAWSGGWYWNSAMDAIAMLPGAIYYLRPESGSPRYTLVYCDVDTPTAPFGLSDQSDGSATRGYREAEITADGTGLVTDEMAWGFGYGSQSPVFRRITDATAVGAHGVWQDGRQAVGVYKQATIDRIADSVINGSPTNHRGAKDDRMAVDLVTYHPGLLAGHVVAFDSAVWGYSDTIPVRQSELTFDAPDAPRWRLLLSHAIDAPWGFFDQFWPKLPGFSFPIPSLPGTPALPAACDCGVTDTFTRTVASGWGTSDAGIPWVDTGLGATIVADVNGSQAEIVVQPFGGVADITLAIPSLTAPYDVVWSGVSWALGSAPSGGAGRTNKAFFEIPTSGFRMQVDGTGAKLLEVESSSGLTTVSFDFTLAAFNVRAHVEPGVQTQYRFWYVGNAEPTTWEATVAGTISYNGNVAYVEASSNMNSTLTVALDSLDITGVTRCTAPQFDDFNRTVPSGWGTATPGGAVWSVYAQSTGSTASVDGASGVLSMLAGSGNSIDMAAPSSIVSLAAWSMLARIPSISPGVVDYGLYVAGSGTAQVWMYATAGYVYGTDNVHVPFTFDGSAYLVRWEFSAGTADNYRIWREQDPEPASWTHANSTTYLSPGSNTLHAVAVNRDASNPQSGRLTSLDFDYAGRPCYYDCSGATTVIDDFNRVVSGSLGTSTLGPAWTYPFTPSNQMSVDGADAVLGVSLTYPDPGATSYANLAAASPFAPGASPWTMTWAGVRFNALDTASSRDDCYLRLGLPDISQAITVYPNNTTASPTFGIDASGDEQVYHSWTAGASYDVVLDYDGVSLLTATLRDSATGTVLLTSAFDWGATLPDNASTEIDWVTHNSVGPGFEFRIDSITVVGGCAPVDPAATGLATGPSGFGCEAPTASSPTVYATSSQFAAGSVLAWVAGLLQRPGTDYTEDAGLQSITFAVAPSGAVRVCYMALAPS